MATHIFTHAGSLPVTFPAQIGSTGPATLSVAGSVWTPSRDTLIGIEVLFDGQPVGTATIWSNGPTTHRAVVPATIPVMLDKQEPQVGTAPTYTVELRPLNAATISDVNDTFSVVLTV